jgi:hypothetical protein
MEEEEVPTPVDEDEPTLEELDVFTMPEERGAPEEAPLDKLELLESISSGFCGSSEQPKTNKIQPDTKTLIKELQCKITTYRKLSTPICQNLSFQIYMKK